MSGFSRFQSSALWEHYLGSTHTVQRPDNRLCLKIAAGATGIRELEARLAAVLAALGARVMESPIPFVATGFTAYHHPQRENNSRVINHQLLKISVEFSPTQAQKYLLSFVLTGNPNPTPSGPATSSTGPSLAGMPSSWSSTPLCIGASNWLKNEGVIAVDEGK